MTLNSRLFVVAAATLTNPLDLATGAVPLELSRSMVLANGVGANQADRLWHDRRDIAASGTDDLDLAGTLLDAFGATLTLARVKAIIVAAAATNVNTVVVGGAAANPFASWVGAGAHTVAVRPGGVLALAAPDATAYPVTAGTADVLRLANGGGGSPVTYDIVVIGASA